VCEIGGERQVYQGRQWADKANEWRQSDEYELDEVSSDHLNSNTDLVTEKPESDLAGHVAGRHLSDHTVQTQDNSVTETNTSVKKKADAEKTMEPYKQNGEAVSADLTGDGEIDAVDWEERYGKPIQNTMSAREDAQVIKQRQRAQQAAVSGQGETVKQADSHSTGTESSDSNASPNANGSSDTDSTENDLPAGVRFT